MYEVSLDETEALELEWKTEMILKKQELSDDANFQCGHTGDAEARRLAVAQRLYRAGLRAEQMGNLQLAVQQYRLAHCLHPEIEPHVYSSLRFTAMCTTNGVPFFENDRVVSLHQHQQQSQSIIFHTDDTQTDQTEHSGKGGTKYSPPLLRLPDELLLLLLRWVVGQDIDLYSLANAACVCRRLHYLVSTDSQLWRRIAHKLFYYNGTKVTKHNENNVVVDWENMLPCWKTQVMLSRPHLLFHGCYISRASYVRSGAPSFNVMTPPVLLVRYYRLLRFWADGHVVMTTGSAHPCDMVQLPCLLHRKHRHYGDCIPQTGYATLNHNMSTVGSIYSHSTVSGTYRYISPDELDIKLCRRMDTTTEHHMNLILRIKQSNGKVGRPRNTILEWMSYSISVVRCHNLACAGTDILLDGTNNSNNNNSVLASSGNQIDITVNKEKFPHLVFSTVRSIVSQPRSGPI